MTNHAAEARSLLKAITADNREINNDAARTLALGAAAHALVAIADALNKPPVGTCTAFNAHTILGRTEHHPCRHPHGHTGAHQSTTGDLLWVDQASGASYLDDEPVLKQVTCGAFRSTADDNGDYPCILKAGHDTDRGTHHADTDGDTWPSSQPPLCGHRNPDHPDMRCTDVPHHYGVHDHLRTWWPNDTYPVEAGVCIATDCHLYGGHPGNHHIRPRPDHTEETPW